MPTATLKIFLAFGDPKRLRTAELSNWTGKAVSGPRSEFDKVLEREESLSPGVYFLTGIDPKSNKQAIYIGEGLIGFEPLRFLASMPEFKNTPGIAETPGTDSDRAQDIKKVIADVC